MYNSVIVSSFIERLEKEQINYYNFNDFSQQDWDKKIDKFENSKLFFSSNQIHYDKEYYNSKYFLILLFHFNDSFCGFKFFITQNDIVIYIPFYGVDFDYLVGLKIIKTINSFFINQNLNIKFVNSLTTNHFVEKLKLSFSKNGFNLISGYDMFIDLNHPKEFLWKTIRKSYRSYINNATKTFSIKTTNNYEKFNDFRLFHKKISGKVTRNINTWEIQYKNIKEQNSIIFYVEDDNANLIGFSIFDIGDSIVTYSVGVYDRTKFNKLQISHHILWHSILYFKKTHNYLYLGYYIANNEEKDLKLSKINDFKMGFCNHMVSNSILFQKK